MKHELDEGELAVLRAISHGLTLGDASTVVGIPVETVKSRLTKARRVLRAKNNAHAVSNAIRQGLIP